MKSWGRGPVRAEARGLSFVMRVGPGLVYGAALFVLGSLPTGGGPPGISDKVVHLVAFALLGLLARWAESYFRPGILGWRSALRAWGWSILAGGGLELWQALLPQRSCEFLDWVADGVGAALGVALGSFAYAVWHRSTRKGAA